MFDYWSLYLYEMKKNEKQYKKKGKKKEKMKILYIHSLLKVICNTIILPFLKRWNIIN